LDLTRPVPQDTVLECIDVASRAPIGGNYELNRWLLIDDAETKREWPSCTGRSGRAI